MQSYVPRSPRTKTALRATFDDGELFLAGRIADVSSTGMFVESDAPLPLGARVRLVAAGVAGDLPVARCAEVVRIGRNDRARPGIGMRFLPGANDDDELPVLLVTDEERGEGERAAAPPAAEGERVQQHAALLDDLGARVTALEAALHGERAARVDAEQAILDLLERLRAERAQEGVSQRDLDELKARLLEGLARVDGHAREVAARVADLEQKATPAPRPLPGPWRPEPEAGEPARAPAPAIAKIPARPPRRAAPVVEAQESAFFSSFDEDLAAAGLKGRRRRFATAVLGVLALAAAALLLLGGAPSPPSWGMAESAPRASP